MADRLKALRRIEAVQGQMVRLAEAKLALAEREAQALAARAEQLRLYLAGPPCDGEEGRAGGQAGSQADGQTSALPASPLDRALGSALSRAALRSLGAVGRAQAAAEREKAERRLALDALRRRGGAVEAAVERAAAEARRAEEGRELSAVVEAWLAAGRHG